MENTIRLRHIGDTLMLDFIGESVSTTEFDINLQYIQKLKEFQKLYINIANLSQLNNDTVDKLRKIKSLLKDKYVCIVNVSAIHNSILNIFGIDKMFQIYMSSRDAMEGKRPIVNRKFRVV